MRRVTAIISGALIASSALVGCAQVTAGSMPSMSSVFPDMTFVENTPTEPTDYQGPPPAPELQIPPPPGALATEPSSLDEISLPTGSGVLLPAWADPAEVADGMKQAGVTDADLRAQQSLVVDVPSGWAFAEPDELTGDPEVLPLSGALVPIDDLVVVSFVGNTCTRAVGGYAYATDGQPTVVLYGGQLGGSCNDVSVWSRVVLWVPGAKAQTDVLSAGGVPSEEVMLPMLDMLPSLVVLPPDLPYYDG